MALVCSLAIADPQDTPIRMVTVKAEILEFKDARMPEKLDSGAGQAIAPHVRDQNPKTKRHYVIVMTVKSKTFK